MILLDVGGTYIKCNDGRQIPAHSDGTKGDVADALRKAIGPLAGVKGIGVAIPGPFDFNNGVFLMKHKYAAAYGESFRTLAKLPATLPVKFHHDVNALLLGAIKLLDLQDSSVALVTLGTGLGFSYALDGKVQYGQDGSPARNLWNMPVPYGGILEDELSSRGICNAYTGTTAEKSRSALAVARMAYAGDEAALKVYSDLGRRLGEVLAPILEELGIKTLLMGGQISGSLGLMSKTLGEQLKGVTIHKAPDNSVFAGLESLFDENAEQ